MTLSLSLNMFAGPVFPHRSRARTGFTLIELAIGLIIIGILVRIALPSYNQYRYKAEVAQAKGDIADLAIRINQYYAENRKFPASLATIGKSTLRDPWNHAYQYLVLDGAPHSVIGKARKDKNLVPINSDFDLYSMGQDGKTATPLTAKPSQDDVIRANDGRFIGLGSEY